MERMTGHRDLFVASEPQRDPDVIYDIEPSSTDAVVLQQWLRGCSVRPANQRTIYAATDPLMAAVRGSEREWSFGTDTSRTSERRDIPV
jgi:hypothetical protein